MPVTLPNGQLQYAPGETYKGAYSGSNYNPDTHVGITQNPGGNTNNGGSTNPAPQNRTATFGGQTYNLNDPTGQNAYQTALTNKPQNPAAPLQATPIVGSPSLQTNQNQTQPISQAPQSPDQVAAPYKQAFTQLSQGKSQAPQDASTGKAMVQAQTTQYQAPQKAQAYQPTPAFMQYGDPIMQSFVGAAMAYQNEAINTGYAAKELQAQFASKVQGIDLEAANLQNIMNGTRDDIRAEISKAGGFATESQVEGLVTTRNRDLLKQYNNIELQKQTMQNQMNLQVGLADADHKYAVDKFTGLTQTATMYKGIYDNATNQIDKLIQNVGYSGMAAAYNYDPAVLGMVEQHLGMPQGTLSDPKALSQLETYREKTLNLSASRFGAMYGYSPNGTPGGNNGGSGGSTGGTFPGGGDHPTSNPNVPYEKYGLLSNTDFNPSNQGDKNAMNYLNTYLNGKLPQNGGDIGISVRGAVGSQQYQSAVNRANDLYFAATGQNLPPTDVIKSNLAIIGANNKLSNNLKIQENTVNANFGLSLQNLNANNLNNAYPILNGVINDIKNAEGDPAVAQYMAQNSTIQQELGNLLAVKNASGTTVYDKIAGAGLLPKNATPAQQVQVVKTLLQEAKNASNAFKQVNGELYQQIDPLERQTSNPNRQSYLNSQLPTIDQAKSKAPQGQILIKRNGQTGYIPESEFNSSTDTKL